MNAGLRQLRVIHETTVSRDLNLNVSTGFSSTQERLVYTNFTRSHSCTFLEDNGLDKLHRHSLTFWMKVIHGLFPLY